MNSTKNQLSGGMKTGIILFSRSRNCEARNKKWHSSHTKNLEIAQHLIETTKSVLLGTGYDVIIIDETKQRGESFGEKIRYAFEDTFKQGYKQLILVGNDTVGLSRKYIFDSISFLNENQVVFGSTKVNGLYLIGFDHAFFKDKSEQITNLPWKTKRLAQSFSELTCLDEQNILPLLSDLNTVDDIQKLLKSRFDVFTEVIQQITHGVRDSFGDRLFAVIQPLHVCKINKRGPPQSV